MTMLRSPTRTSAILPAGIFVYGNSLLKFGFAHSRPNDVSEAIEGERNCSIIAVSNGSRRS
jgi:hypothetical protein